MSHDKVKKLRAGEHYFDILVLACSVFLLIIAYQISGFAISGPGTFPMLSTAVMVFSTLFVIWGNWRKKRINKEGFLSECRQALQEVFTPTFVIYTIITIVYVALIEPLHFLPASFIFLIVSMIVLRGSSPLKALLITTGTLTFIYVIFLYFFKVLLP